MPYTIILPVDTLWFSGIAQTRITAINRASHLFI